MKALPSISAVLFDLDGTLLDTANDLGETLNHLLARDGYPLVERERYRPVASDGALGLLTLGYGASLPSLNYEALRQDFLAYYENNIAKYTELYDGIVEVINWLEQQSIPWGIITNKPIGLTNHLLPHYPALASAQVVYGGDSFKERKPHPRPLLEAADVLNVKSSNCLYIGDAPRDIEAANAAGMFSIVAQWGYITNKSQCASWQADAIAATPRELVTMIK